MTERILYPRKDAAFMLGISVRTLDQYAKVSEIHPRFIGGKVLYHRSELERFAKGNRSSPFPKKASLPEPSMPQPAHEEYQLPIAS